jgi:hypothetical protein
LEKCTAPLSDLAQELVKAQFLLRKKGRNSSGGGIRRQRRAAAAAAVAVARSHSFYSMWLKRRPREKEGFFTSCARRIMYLLSSKKCIRNKFVFSKASVNLGQYRHYRASF